MQWRYLKKKCFPLEMITDFVLFWRRLATLFVGRILKKNIYPIKINIRPLWGALFNFKNLHHLRLIKIRLLKLIIRKANKTFSLVSVAQGENNILRKIQPNELDVFSLSLSPKQSYISKKINAFDKHIFQAQYLSAGRFVLGTFILSRWQFHCWFFVCLSQWQFYLTLL